MDFAALTGQGWMELISLIVCLPLMLIMNFSLFQYLLTMFYRRRLEPLVRSLLAIAFLSFASLIPFGFPDTELVRDLNDISETCSVLTFLLQINILTRDINKKMKLRTLVWLVYIGELLVAFGLVVIALNIVDLVAPEIDISRVEVLDDLVENLSLIFIFVFRFYFLSMAKGGLRNVLHTQRTELAFYALFVTHQYPFHLLGHLTGLDWQHVQGVWMRTTILLCLWMTIKTKLASRNSKFAGHSTLGHSIGRTTQVEQPKASATRGPAKSWVSPLKNAVAVAPNHTTPGGK